MVSVACWSRPACNALYCLLMQYSTSKSAKVLRHHHTTMEADSDAASSIASIDSDDSNKRQKKALRVIQAAASAVLLITQPYVDRSLCRTSMSGSAYIDELLQSGHPQRC